MEAKVTFTEETKKAMTKELSPKNRSELLAKRLKEVAENGELHMATNRADVARLCGYTEATMKNGYAWVARMVSTKVLSEVIHHFDGNKRVYQYYYNGEGGKNTNTKKVSAKKVVAKTVEVTPYELPKEEIKIETNKTTTISIRRGETTVSMENVSGDMIVEIIKTIFN